MKEEEEFPEAKFKVQHFLKYLGIIIFIILIISIIVIFKGVKDLKDDKNILIVEGVEGKVKAVIMYDRVSEIGEAIDFSNFPDYSNLKKFHDFTLNSLNNFDRLVIITPEGLENLGNNEVEFRGEKISIVEINEYILDKKPLPARFKGEGWKVKGDMLASCISDYHKKVWKGEISLDSLFEEYRKSNIFAYPTNGALFFLKIIPLEKLII